jgi:hypothetical protein
MYLAARRGVCSTGLPTQSTTGALVSVTQAGEPLYRRMAGMGFKPDDVDAAIRIHQNDEKMVPWQCGAVQSSP